MMLCIISESDFLKRFLVKFPKKNFEPSSNLFVGVNVTNCYISICISSKIDKM